MSGITSTITSKWQVTIPEEVRKELPLEVGQRIAWQVEGNTLVGRRVRSIKELAGSLKSSAPVSSGKVARGALAQAALDRHDRLSRQKP